MGYTIAAGVLALLASMKYTVYLVGTQDKKIKELEEKIESVEKRLGESETEIPKRVMATMLPVAKAVQKLNQQVGL